MKFNYYVHYKKNSMLYFSYMIWYETLFNKEFKQLNTDFQWIYFLFIKFDPLLNFIETLYHWLPNHLACEGICFYHSQRLNFAGLNFSRTGNHWLLTEIAMKRI